MAISEGSVVKNRDSVKELYTQIRDWCELQYKQARCFHWYLSFLPKQCMVV